MWPFGIMSCLLSFCFCSFCVSPSLVSIRLFSFAPILLGHTDVTDKHTYAAVVTNEN